MEVAMKTRFPLLPLFALVAAVLACDRPTIGSGGDYPTIKALVVTPPPLGRGDFTVTITLSPYKRDSYIRCNAVDPSDESERVYESEIMKPSANEKIINFRFLTWEPPGNHNLICFVVDSASDTRDSETTPFTVTGEVTATPTLTATPTETLIPTPPPAATQTPTATAVQLQPQLVNPGFEQGFTGWSEDPAVFQYGGQSVEGTDAAHSGQRSRKLFLRWGGSHILQRINVNLGVGSQITLTAWVKMPSPGDRDNKWFVLELWAGSADGHQEVLAGVSQMNALPNWSQLSLGPITTDFPITWLEIHARTNAGGGTYQDYDKPVWVDDFELSVQAPP